MLLFLLTDCQPAKLREAESKAEKFPQDWAGEWEGRLNIYKRTGKSMDLYMGLNILPIDSIRHTFTIIYGEGEKRQERLYEVFQKKGEIGHYIVDEKNSILLDDFLFHNKLFSRFEVEGNLLLVTYEKQGEEILFEVISGKLDPLNETGGQDSISTVHSYGISVMQKAILRRKKKD